MSQQKIHLVNKDEIKTRCGKKVTSKLRDTFDIKNTTCKVCLDYKPINHEAYFTITQYLIRLYAKKHNIPLIKLKNIKYRRCAYCLGTIKEKGYMRKFRENKIVLHRCIDCSWKLGICKIITHYLKKGYKLKDYGIWSDPNNLRKHKKEIMEKYKL